MAQVKPIPPGMHTLTAHLTVKGAAAAIEFYKKAFGTVELARMPMPDGKLGHAHLKIGDSHLLLNDEPNFPGSCKSPQTLGGNSVALQLYVEDVDAVFNRAVAAGRRRSCRRPTCSGATATASSNDPFGQRWSIATHKEDVPPEEMQKRAEAMFAQMAQDKNS